MRGVRDYCQAYHGGSNRKELIDLLVKHRTEKRPELLHKYPWPARNPNGKINVASMLDMQDWYVKNNLTRRSFRPSGSSTTATSTTPTQKLGPFELENKDSKLAGCR